MTERKSPQHNSVEPVSGAKVQLDALHRSLKDSAQLGFAAQRKELRSLPENPMTDATTIRRRSVSTEDQATVRAHQVTGNSHD